MLQVIFCTEDMISRSLWEAMNTKQPNLDASKVSQLNSLIDHCASALTGLLRCEIIFLYLVL